LWPEGRPLASSSLRINALFTSKVIIREQWDYQNRILPGSFRIGAVMTAASVGIA